MSNKTPSKASSPPFSYFALDVWLKMPDMQSRYVGHNKNPNIDYNINVTYSLSFGKKKNFKRFPLIAIQL